MSNIQNNGVTAGQGKWFALLLCLALLCPLFLQSAYAQTGTLPAAKGISVEPDLSAQGQPETETLNLSLMSVAGQVDRYVDQYLLESNISGNNFDADTEDSEGRRLTGGEFIFYRNANDVVGDSTELGLRLSMRRETRQFGELDLELLLSDLDVDYINRQTSSSDLLFTLRQSNLPLTNNWRMDNLLGFMRNNRGSVLNSGFRVRLPNSPLLGLSSTVQTFDKKITFFGGKTGFYEGTAIRQFNEDGGRSFGVGYEQEVTPGNRLGVELVNFNGNAFVREHSSVKLAGQFANFDYSSQLDINALADDDSNLGLWADAMNFIPGDIQLRYGAFYMQPELAWLDRPIANNQAGIYIRSDKQSVRYTLSAGYDYLDSGLDDGFFPGSQTHSSFINGNYRFTRNLTLGLNANLGFRSINSLTDENQTFWRLNNFLFYRLPIGTSRVELFTSTLNSNQNSNEEDRQGLRLSHEWRMPQSLRLTTELRLEQADLNGQNRDFQEAAVYFRQNIGDEWTWGINASVYLNDSDLVENNGLGFNGDLSWRFLPDWFASLNVLYNVNQIKFDNISPILTEENPESSSVWLTISYSKASGQPLMNLGRNSGRTGSGRVSGIVFFDENQDFIRQPGEETAAGIVVVLDGRYEAMTDQQGRYTFDPVYTGKHFVAVNTDELPLPWSLLDETPRQVEVNLRQTGEVDFPLIRIN